MPFLWVLVLLLLTVFLKSPKWRRGCLLSALALLLLFSNPFLANEAWRAWEVDAVPISQVGSYDAAIILGGITGSSATVADRVHTRKGADRFLHPLYLYRLGKVDKFILTGGSGTILSKGTVTEAEQLQKVLLLAGVPAHKILLETQSRNTRENATNTAELLQNYPELDTLLLVTSAFHMRRSAGCFDKAGLNTTSFSADFYATERKFTPDEFLIPSIQAFSNWHLLIHEMAGYITYKVLGYC